MIWDAFRCTSHIGDMSYFKLQPQRVSEKIYKKTKQSSCPESRSYCLLKIQWFKKSPVWIWLKYHMLVLGQPNIFTVVSSLQDSAKDLNLIPCFVYLTKQRAMLMPVQCLSSKNIWRCTAGKCWTVGVLRVILQRRGLCMRYQEIWN